MSVDSAGEQSNNHIFDPTVSASGDFVAFDSRATNLVPQDTNGEVDVFVHNRQTGVTERVSVDSSGGQANSASSHPAISADGRFVSFVSEASNLVPGDTNFRDDVFVHDRQTGVTERVNVDSSGGQANDGSVFPATAISADGRFVAFDSEATNLVSGDTNYWNDVFVRDRQTGVTERVSVDSSGGEANNASVYPSISADGRFVAFGSAASNLVPGDTNYGDVFVHDRLTGATGLVDVNGSGAQANGASLGGEISGDGRFVAFESTASNLVPGDTNRRSDTFVHDRQTGATERVSVDSSGEQAKQDSLGGAMSADGRFVAFQSKASNLVPGDTNLLADIFVHDRQTGATERVSVDGSGGQANNDSSFATLSADGQFAAFESSATNLVPGDTNSAQDAFVRDRQAAAAPLLSSFGPTSGITGSGVTLDGANFDTVTNVRFNGRGAKFKILSPTRIRATVPDGATSGRINLFNPNGARNSPGDYTVTFSITTLAPTNGPVGTVVDLTGIGFSDVTAVKFKGLSAAFTILSPTSIRASVPTGATTGKVTASSPQGTVTGPKFTVTTG